MNFLSQIFFNDINNGYSCIKEIFFVAASILYVVATYFYYEKISRTMRTAIVSDLFKYIDYPFCMKRFHCCKSKLYADFM